MAQLVAQLLCKQKVLGSSPSGSTPRHPWGEARNGDDATPSLVSPLARSGGEGS